MIGKFLACAVIVSWIMLCNGKTGEEIKIRRSSVFLPFVETSLQTPHTFHSAFPTSHLNKHPLKRTMVGIPKIHTSIEEQVRPSPEKKFTVTSATSTLDITASLDSFTTSSPSDMSDVASTSIEALNNSAESTSIVSNVSEPSLELIEEKLRKSNDKDSNSLLLAISLLHNHQPNLSSDDSTQSNIVSVISKSDGISQRNTDGPILEKLHQRSKPTPRNNEIENITSEKSYKTKRYHFVTNQEVYKEVESSVTSYHETKEPAMTHQTHQFHWFVLLLDGKCCEIRHRMNTFVRYLKATLAAKLEAKYDDIYVPSVLCDSSFMVNVSFDLSLYPDAYQKLHRMADVNTTLLEISGEIFYLEKVLSSQPVQGLRLQDYFDRNYDMKVVLYVTMGCMSAFILISVVTITLIKVCYQRYNAQDDPLKTISIEEKPPQVIYSPDFSHSLKINEQIQHSFATSPTLEEGIAPHGSSPQSSFGSRLNAFKCQLIGNKLDRDSEHQNLMEEVDQDTDFLDLDTEDSDC